MFFSLESAHYVHVVQELDGFNVHMMVETFFMLLSKPLDFTGYEVYYQVSAEVVVCNVPVSSDHVP
jgi:hypothetical protein